VTPRGPRLGTKLLLVSLVLLTVPWLAWQAAGAVEAFLVDGQRRALALTARGIATLVAQPLAALRSPRPEEEILVAVPLASPPQFDGYGGDWEAFEPAVALPGGTGDSGGFSAWLGNHGEMLFGLIRVTDPTVIYRHPGIPRRNSSDRILLELGPDRRRVVLAAEGPGRFVPRQPGSPFESHGSAAVWQPTARGYDVEFRVPLALLGEPPLLQITVVDVDDAIGRTTRGRQATGLRPLVHRPAALERLLAGLDDAPGRAWVVDRHGWVRAGAGPGARPAEQPRPARLTLDPLTRALGGTSAHGEWTRARFNGDHIVVAEPVTWNGSTVGAVVVEQDVDEILLLRYRTFLELAVATLGMLGLSAMALLLFASRLAWRIRRLGRETAAALDSRGRLLAEQLEAEASSGDELGELSRAISGLLERLRHHTRFQRSLPRTLRHEISNPLNTIATALQNLAADTGNDRREHYLASAGRGLQRLETTLNGLTEAASLDEALNGERYDPLDLVALLDTYLESLALQRPQQRIVSSITAAPLQVRANGHRIEQLLDKLLDNALDFTPANGCVTVTLTGDANQAILRVDNDGPPLPAGSPEGLFEAMSSSRAGHDATAQHMGLGLYVVRRIAEAHSGTVTVRDRDGGVCFEVRLPRAAPDGDALRYL